MLLRETNGYRAVLAKHVLVAGHEFVKSVQPPEHKGFILAQLDKKVKDRKLSRSYVMITQGKYKGLKGKVISADDNVVKLELQATVEKVVLPREHVTEVKDLTTSLSMEPGAFNVPQSFDEAAKQDIAANSGLLQDPYAARQLGFWRKPAVPLFGIGDDHRMTRADDADPWA